MQTSSEIRRLFDGSIDFDFYRRRAARQRRYAREAAIRRCLAAAVQAADMSVSVIATFAVSVARRLATLRAAVAVKRLPLHRPR
jgi:hypothetical protein